MPAAIMRAMPALSHSFKAYLDRRVLVIILLGFSSGLPLALTASTLFTWMRDVGIDLKTIGLFALVATPYTFKFLWSPFVDHYKLPLLYKWLGRRRSWILLTQLVLIALTASFATIDPLADIETVVWLALALAFTSATQDIAVDAYRVEILKDHEQGLGAAAVQYGYRAGMYITGGVTLFLAEFVGWHTAYLLILPWFGLAILATLFMKEPKETRKKQTSTTLTQTVKKAVLDPFANFMQRESWLVLLVFIVLFKFGDALAGVMTNPFLIDLGFTKAQIGFYVKTIGPIPTYIGIFLGGVMAYQMGIWRALWICGILQMLSNLMFVAQAYVGADPGVLIMTVAIENLAGGMGSAAFVAFLSMLCHREFTATQYALLSSLAVTGRTVLSSSSGYLADALGWLSFFALTALAALPGLLLLYFLKDHLGKVQKPRKA